MAISNVASDFIGQHADNKTRLWASGFIVGEEQEDPFVRLENTGEDAVIQQRHDLSKMAGDEIIFRTRAGLYGKGTSGDNEPTSFEKVKQSAFSVRIDYKHHAIEWTKRTEQIIDNELQQGVNVMLGQWWGRKKRSDLMMTLIHRGSSVRSNVVYANGKGSREALRSADVVSFDTIVNTAQILRTLGGRAAINRVSRNSEMKRVLKGFYFLGTGEGFLGLKNSSDYRQAVREGHERGDGNPLFTGEFVSIDGNHIWTWDPQDHDGAGPIGSPLNPKAVLGIAIDGAGASDTQIDITGGGNATDAADTEKEYFEFFSNFAYTFGTESGEQLSAGTTDRYVMIYNLVDSAAGGDAGKWGFYRFRTNNGNKLTIHSAASRLASANGTYKNTTVGNVTWDSTKNTVNHPSGSIIMECNSYGVPFGRTLVLGRHAGYRAYGRESYVRTTDATQTGGYKPRTWIRGCYGQATFKRRDGLCPNYLVVEHPVRYAGLGLPTI